MSDLLFPQLPGLRWEMKSTDEFSTIAQSGPPGIGTWLLLGEDPIPRFELIYNFLRQPGAQGGYGGADELNILRSFFRARQGDFDSFLLYLPQVSENQADGAVTGQALAPDANNVAPLIVSRAGGYNENVYEAAGVNSNPLVTGSSAPVIRKDGTALVSGTDYTIQGPGYAAGGVSYPGLVVVFTASVAGHAITADFTWYYRVRFAQKSQEYQKFLAYLYSAQKVQLKVWRTP